AENVGWAFQIGFVGSVFFGLTAWYLLLGGRHVAASGCLIAALMCSSIGEPMVVGAAVIALVQHPRHRALLALVAPVTAYLTWFALIGHLGLNASTDNFSARTARALP